MKKAIGYGMALAFCACALVYGLSAVPGDPVMSGEEAQMLAAYEEGGDRGEETQGGGKPPEDDDVGEDNALRVVEPLVEDEIILRASMQCEADEPRIEITYTQGEYRLSEPVQGEIKQSVAKRYLQDSFAIEAQARVTEAEARMEDYVPCVTVTLETNLRTIVLVTARREGDNVCLVSDSEGQVYKVRAGDIPWRGASVETLTGRMFYGRRARDVKVLEVSTRDGQYTFTREGENVRLNGKDADALGFDRLMETLFTLPLYAAEEIETLAPEEKGVTVLCVLTYTDGQQDAVNMCFEKSQALVDIGTAQEYYTDTWRVNTFLIACAGVAMD